MYKGYVIYNFDEQFDCQEMESLCTDGMIDLSESKESMYSVNKEFNSCLDKFVLDGHAKKDLMLDGTKIINECFPKVKADIFISHSHKDVEKAKQFAKLIYWQTGMKSFIDSEVWIYADSLLKIIDENCKRNDGLYDYNQRNISTSYVHMMLNTALLNMIDRCECLFFLSTPESFETVKEIKNSTFSPWIYSELSMANAIEKKIPTRLKNIKKSLRESVKNFSAECWNSQEDLKIALKPNIENLIECDFSVVKNWLIHCDQNKNNSNLDDFYKIKKKSFESTRSLSWMRIK